MSKPLVSIIIPAYNSEKYISETLNSILSQTYRNMEIIVVDDGSSDRTAEIIKSYQTKRNDKPDLIYIHQLNAGPSNARNTGIRAAKGKYIAFLDSDDLWTDGKLEKQVSYMEANSDVALVFGDMSLFSSEGTLTESAFRKYGFPQCDQRGRVTNAFKELLERNYISTGTVLLKKECFGSAGYFDELLKYAEDYDLWLRISLMFKIGCIPEIFRSKRMHDSNLAKEEESFYKSNIYILHKIKKNYSPAIAHRKININNYIFKAIKKLSYFYYIKKQYIKALRALILSYTLII